MLLFIQDTLNPREKINTRFSNPCENRAVKYYCLTPLKLLKLKL